MPPAIMSASSTLVIVVPESAANSIIEFDASTRYPTASASKFHIISKLPTLIISCHHVCSCGHSCVLRLVITCVFMRRSCVINEVIKKLNVTKARKVPLYLNSKQVLFYLEYSKTFL